MATAQPIRSKKQVRALADHYRRKGQLRNYVLVVMGVHTALRISDLLRLTWDDVYDFAGGQYRRHIHLTEQKTGKSKEIAINREAVRALVLFDRQGGTRVSGRYLFENNRKEKAPISRVQAYRIIRGAAAEVGLLGSISCHSLRKTFGYHAWKSGVPVPVIMDIYNHTSFAVTRRYLGVCQDDRDQVYLDMTFA